jgi:hypothetical protein
MHKKNLGCPINYIVTWVPKTYRSQSQNKLQRGWRVLILYIGSSVQITYQKMNIRKLR